MSELVWKVHYSNLYEPLIDNV